MTSPKLTADELEATVRSLIGRRIEAVVYCDVSSDGASEVVWDFDEWHDVVMGVEFTIADGTAYSASWDNAFCQC